MFPFLFSYSLTPTSVFCLKNGWMAVRRYACVFAFVCACMWVHARACVLLPSLCLSISLRGSDMIWVDFIMLIPLLRSQWSQVGIPASPHFMEIDHEIITRVMLSLSLIKVGSCQLLGKACVKELVNRLEDLMWLHLTWHSLPWLDQIRPGPNQVYSGFKRSRYASKGNNTDRHGNTITKTCLVKYTENFTTKKWKFSGKNFWYFFSYFCSKHRLWVHVRTASMRRF